MTCPSEDTLLQYVGGYLSQQQGDEVEHHLDQCPNCRRLLCSFARDGSVSSSGRLTLSQVSNTGLSFPSSGNLPTAESIERGTLLDRYLVIECLGLGGMGVVYKAYDPDLDRKVALKLLHPTKVLSEQAEQLLVREARLMAKVIHPNVVMVHEIAQANGCSLVAMEFVKGKNLSQWIDEKKRTWQEILSVLVEAGHGLSAAHHAGLVHRDFKPTNVMVTQEGHAKVADFGLAGIEWKPANSGAWTVPLNVTAQSGDVSLGEGGLIGSPAYMSAAQFEGKKADAQSDQFSFCVTLYEALFQQHPFRNMSFDELRKDVLAGKVRPPPKNSKVPTRILHAVLRGLSRDPEDRFTSMDDLLLQLESRSSGLFRWALAILFFVLLGAGGAWLGHRLWQRSELCENAAGKWEKVWDPERQADMRRRFVSTGLESAEVAYQKSAGIIETYIQEWNRVFKSSCEATQRFGEQSERILDLRQQCLERRRGELKALIDVMTASADKEMVNRAVDAAQRLTPLGGCSDVQALSAILPPPEDPRIREQVSRLQRRLDEVGAYLKANNAVIGLPLAEKLVEEVQQVNYPPVLAEALFDLAELRYMGGKDPPLIEETYLSAAKSAAEGRNDMLLAQALISRIWVTSLLMDKPNQALELSKTVEVVLARLGSEQKRVGAFYHSTMARVYYDKRSFEKAKEEYLRSFGMLREVFGEQHVETQRVSLNLAMVMEAMGEHVEAEQRCAAVVASLSQLLGPRHPEVARAMGLHVLAFIHQGKYLLAEERLRDILQIIESSWGEKNPVLASNLINLGKVLTRLGRFQEARDALERALKIFVGILGSGHSRISIVLQNLAELALAEGRSGEALSYCQQALAIQNKASVQEPTDMCYCLACLGNVYRKMGRCDQTIKITRQAIALMDKSQKDHVALASVLLFNGECERKRGNLKVAESMLERALQIHERFKSVPEELAETQFSLAQALWSSGLQLDRAWLLAQQSQERYAGLGDAFKHERDEVSRWLKDRQEKRLPR